MSRINQTVLMSDARNFGVVELNVYSYKVQHVDVAKSIAEHDKVYQAAKQIGISVIKVPAPKNCQDGVFTANWGLCRGDKVILSSLPNARKLEEPYAEQVLKNLGKKVIKAPYYFSGQGDALPCGNYLLAGSGYRTDERMHRFIADELGYEVVSLRTIPALTKDGLPITNKVSGLQDSFFYDIDLAIAVLRTDLIAWCPEAFDEESKIKIKALPIKKIEVDINEAWKGLACNLVSSGESVLMSSEAPKLKSAIEAEGLEVITLSAPELAKGGGFIRCTMLTLDNG